MFSCEVFVLFALEQLTKASHRCVLDKDAESLIKG